MTAKEKALLDKVVRAAMRWHKAYTAPTVTVVAWQTVRALEDACAALAAHQKGKRHAK